MWSNNQDPQGPAYSWIDINSLPGVFNVVGLSDDNWAGPFTMPIAFQYYGLPVTQFWIGSNGYIKFLSGVVGLAQPFPTIPSQAGINNYLAVLTADLTFTDNNSNPISGVECKFWSSADNDSMVITFENVPFWSPVAPWYSGSNTFQVILNSADNSVLFQYANQTGLSANPANFLSVGIENYNGTDGLQIMYNQYPASNMAIQIIANDFNLIEGNIFADLNSNSVRDFGELTIPNVKITESITGRFNFSNLNGDYSLSVLDSGNFQVFTDGVFPTYYTASPAANQVYFSGLNLTDSLNDFGLQPIQVVDDIRVTITPLTPFRPGFSASYSITCFNIGTTISNPTITLYIDSNVTFLSSDITPNTIYNDSLVWSFLSIAPFESKVINVNVVVDTFAVLGTLVNSYVLAEPIITDNTPFNNYSSWEVIVTGSYDPNDILVDRSNIFDYEMLSPPFLEYIIRFQNTGTDTAFTVKVLNPIPQSLDMSTLEIVEVSHNMDFRWYSDIRIAEYIFSNIQLPDSSTNESQSHGFIRYRIKPDSSLSVGATIRDSALIYFDFNLPITTNTALTTIIEPSFSGVISDEDFVLVYPNPVLDKLFFDSDSCLDENMEVNVLDGTGRFLLTLKSIYDYKNDSFEADISQLSPGIYFLMVRCGDFEKTAKFIKMKS
jgi:hypothetical protein